MYKNIEKSQVLTLADLVELKEGQVVSKTLVQNEGMGVTLFAFAKDEQISTHKSGGDALVTILEGKGRLTIDGKDYVLNANESIVMPAGIPHAVYALEQMKMLLTVSF